MDIEIPDITEEFELNQQGVVLIGNNKYEESLIYFDKAKKINPMYIDTYINSGTAYASLGKIKEAEEQFKKASLIDKKNPDVYFHLGNISFLKDEIEKGIEYYNKAISSGYEDPQIYYNLGMVYEQLDNHVMAIRNYTKAISKDRLNPEFRLKLASAYINSKKHEEALVVLEELNQYCPDVFEGYHLRFQIYCAKEDFAKAEEVINHAIELFPKDVSLFYNKIKLTNMKGEFEKALLMIDEAEKMEDCEIEQRNLCFERAKVYAQKTDIDNCIKYLEKTIDCEDDYIDYEARYFLMNAYLSAENYEKLYKLADFLATKEEGETSYVMSAIYYRALSLKKLNKEEESIKYLKEANKIFRAITISKPTDLDAYMFRILCLKELKEYDKALEIADYVLLLKGNSAEAYVMKASVYKEMGEEDKAEKAMIEAGKYNDIYNKGMM